MRWLLFSILIAEGHITNFLIERRQHLHLFCFCVAVKKKSIPVWRYDWKVFMNTGERTNGLGHTNSIIYGGDSSS